MTMPVTQCLIKLHEAHHNLEDYQGGVPRWCSGCGDNAILAAVQRLCRDEDLAPERTVFVSGIGCSSRFPHYMKTYGFHGIHGRAFPIAQGVKMARPDLAVFVNTGDGDCCSIGAAHWIHAIRYNMNLTVILHDNHVYGLTKKQASPTSPRGLKSNTTPRGATLEAMNPLTVTLGVTNVSFVAQAVDWIPELLFDIIQKAYHHRGFSFVRIIQRCPEFLPKMFEPWLHDPGRTLLLTHPNGLTLSPELSRTYRNQIEHDPSNIDRAREIASSEDPIPVGILYHNPAVPCYDDLRAVSPMRTSEQIRAGLESELDKVTVWPRRRRARAPGRVSPPAPRSTAITAPQAAMDTATRHHEQQLFFSTGRRHGEGVDAIDGLGLRPALLARYRDLTRLRYDFPLVLVDRGPEAGTIRSLSSVVDEVLQEIAPRGIDGERLRKHVLRLEREVRALARRRRGGTLTELWGQAAQRAGGAGRPARRRACSTHIAEKLQLDGDVVDCDRAMPARVLAHAWQAAQQRKGKAFRDHRRAADRQAVRHPARGVHPLGGGAAARGAARVAGRHAPRSVRLRA